MLYLNAKYLLLADLPWESPYVIASVEATPDTATHFHAKNWPARSPALLFSLTSMPGVLSFAGWVAKKTALRGPPLDDYQRTALLTLFNAIKAGRAGPGDSIASHEMAHWQAGAKMAVEGKPADPSWLPEPDPVWLDTALMGANPWDGWAKWAERHGRTAVGAEPAAESVPLTKGERPAKTKRVPKRKDAGRDIFAGG